jgi:tetratricopeptide (TPR) repeat protein
MQNKLQAQKKQNKAKPNEIGNVDIESLFIEANAFKITGDLEKAKSTFKKVIEKDNANAASYFELARIAKLEKDIEEAQKLCIKAIENDSENSYYNYFLAEILMDKRDYKNADKKVYETLIKNEPDNVSYYQELSFAQIQAEKYEEAIQTLNNVEKRLGTIDEVSEQKQKLYIRMGKMDKAILEAQNLLHSQPDEPRYYQRLVELYIEGNKFDEAEKILEKARQLFPEDTYAIFGMAELYRRKNDKEALSKLLMQLFENPKADIDGKISYLMPFINDVIKQTEYKNLAIDLASKLPEYHPQEAKSWAMYADMLYQDNQNEKALQNYRESIKRDNGIFTVWQQIFFIENDNRKWEDLQNDTKQAMELYPNQALVHFFNGVALQQLKQFKNAITSYENAEVMSMDNTQMRAQILSSLGEIYQELKNFAKSDSKFEESLQLNPKNEFALNNWAYYLSLRKTNLDKAEKMSKQSLDIAPKNASFLDTYAWILFQQQKYEAAYEWQIKCMENGGDKSPTNHEHLGDILFKLNKKDEAVKSWEKAREMGEKSELLEKKIKEKSWIE